MLVLKCAQRAVIADKVADVANLAVGALVFGQALTESLGRCTSGRSRTMTFFLVLFGGIVLFVTIIGTLDLIGRRRQRQSQHPAREAP